MKLIFNSDDNFKYPYKTDEKIIYYLMGVIKNEVIVEIKINIYTLFAKILVKIIIYTRECSSDSLKKMKCYKKTITLNEYMNIFD